MKGVYPRPIRMVEIPIGPSIAIVELTQGQISIIDSSDAEEAGRFNWSAAFDSGFYRAVCKINGKTEHLSRFLVGANDGQTVDHKNGDTLDNRRSNLRPCAHDQNTRNRRMKKPGRAGLKGVGLDGRNFKAAIKYQGKRMHLGNFPCPLLAHIAYCRAARKYHGEFASFS